mgnify:CR=1 FL=1|uniref:Ribosomal RNA large subunit methyltransferase K/L-like methyltransferase domain-containing protein n=1 Tax=candidate division CPR3 bacterium TaxID=2268181 RepID=A0A7C4M3L3_UNCC3
MLYAFILGKNPTLSIAEIISVLKRDSFVFVILSITSKSLVIKLDKKIENTQFFLDKIGGTIKIAEIFSIKKEKEVLGELLNYISDNFQNQKFIFGISKYDISLPKIGFELKKELKKININSRFVKGKDKSLSAPEIKNNKILTHGSDFVLIREKNNIYIGKTIAIQDYISYSYRDYNRPRRNAKSGMLPPKIAQIMINLIPLKINSKVIYDPFCGQGTVLQEASLIDLKSMGSDISPERIFDTKENLKWLKREYNLNIHPEEMVFLSDALKIKNKDFKNKPDFIVSEVYLGPPMKGNENEKEIISIINKIEHQCIFFLKNIVLSKINIRYLILAIPYYNLKNKKYYLNIIDEFKKMSYNVIDPFNNTEIEKGKLKEYNQERKTIEYIRENQIVGRELFILEKKYTNTKVNF